MFKKSDIHSQLDLFSSQTEYDSMKKKCLKDDSWHNQFRNHVVMRVDESIFSMHYTDGQGAHNAFIRVLVSMMILKEGQGWSEELLIENWAYSHSLKVNFVRIVNCCVKPYRQRKACLNYAVVRNSITSVKYITQICQRSLLGQKMPQYIANLCFNMYIIVNTLSINKRNHICPANLHLSAF